MDLDNNNLATNSPAGEYNVTSAEIGFITGGMHLCCYTKYTVTTNK